MSRKGDSNSSSSSYTSSSDGEEDKFPEQPCNIDFHKKDESDDARIQLGFTHSSFNSASESKFPDEVTIDKAPENVANIPEEQPTADIPKTPEKASGKKQDSESSSSSSSSDGEDSPEKPKKSENDTKPEEEKGNLELRENNIAKALVGSSSSSSSSPEKEEEKKEEKEVPKPEEKPPEEEVKPPEGTDKSFLTDVKKGETESSSDYDKDEEEEEEEQHEQHRRDIPPFKRPTEQYEIPPNLAELVYHAKDSLTYQALEGRQLHGLTQNALTSIVNDLRKYLDLAVDNNLIDEACYVQDCIDNVREDKSAVRMQLDRELHDIDMRIEETKQEIDERKKFWDREQEVLQREFQMALDDLEINRDQAVSDLDREWQSPKKLAFYSKPSPQLLNMRHVAKKMIRAKQFEEVKKVARLMDAKEKEETEEANKRMNEDYHLADQRLQEQFDHERNVIISTHEKKEHNLIRNREQNLRPILQRLDNLMKQKEMTTKTKKNAVSHITQPRRPKITVTARMTSRSASANKHQTQQQVQPQLPVLLGAPKLALKPVDKIKRGSPSRQQQAPNNSQTSHSICRPKTLQRLSSSKSINNKANELPK